MLKKWQDLPKEMQNDEVLKYYNILKKKRFSLFLKRCFDIFASLILIILLLIPMVIIALMIKLDSKGEAVFRQIRITKYNKEFKIFKFRTMVKDAENLGTKVTTKNDMRITKVGAKLRKLRLDELPQLYNVLKGEMTFVGARPEVPKYVSEYTDEMLATLLLPAGITSFASIQFKDEDELLANEKDTDFAYINKILPKKMEINLSYIKDFSLFLDLKIMFKTVLAVFG